LLTGWLWFCGTLVPVIGLVQVGGQAMADRYSYIPSLGLFILAVWGAYELAQPGRHHELVLGGAGCVAIILCMGLTRQQLGYWQNSETLYRHALAVTKNNYLAHHNLGIALFKQSRVDEAISQYREALRLKPDYAEAHYDLGSALAVNDQTDAAIVEFQKAIQLEPDYAPARVNLGTALGREGQTDEAIGQYREALRLQPDNAELYYDLGTALGMNGRIDEAIVQFQEALRLQPDYAAARHNLDHALQIKNAPASR
jgi:tetratricopeptide (TPR) repeat protein